MNNTNICRAENCPKILYNARHIFCRKHYHQKHLEGLPNEAGQRPQTRTIDTLQKKCSASGCNQIVFREHHDLCRTHYHQLRLNQCK